MAKSSTKEELITPQIAEELLKNNAENRPFKMPWAITLADAMTKGEWHEDTGEALKIAEDGTLIDGQHRLTAVIISGKQLRFAVMRNAKKEIFKVIDSGIKRTGGDALATCGVKNASWISAIIKSYNAIKKQRSQDTRQSGGLSNSQVLSMYFPNERLWQEIFKKAQMYYNDFSKIINGSTIGGLYAVFHEISPSDAEAFFDGLCKGVALTESDAVFVLRQRLMNDKMSKGRLPQQYKLALMIKAWNLFRAGKPAKILKWNSIDEEFPVPS